VAPGGGGKSRLTTCVAGTPPDVATPDDDARDELVARHDELMVESRRLIADLDRALSRAGRAVSSGANRERQRLVAPGERAVGEHAAFGADGELGAAGEQLLEDDSTL